ncbi:MAG: hypothetical protein COA75_05245 [Cellvibrionales bacterium]|nr:MAG: hypothetical protein COA75_05245 [Cellvibrionales bacterium]
MAPKSMFEGIKVIDFSHYVAGPHCTKMLAEHGAEVIKIEPLTGDPARMLPMHKEGRSAFYVQHNLAKKSLSLDLTRPEAQKICHDLIKNADVVVENFTPGVMKRHNMDWETLKAINPNLVMCSISCFGQDGPLAELPGYDFIGQAYAGILDMNGEPGRTPVFADLTFGDVSSGTHAYAAIVAALFHRFRGGEGQHLDLCLQEILFSYHDMSVQLYNASGGTYIPKRSGATHNVASPAGIFKCGERYLFVVALGAQWEKLAKTMGCEELLSDPRFADLAARGVNKDALNGIVQSWLETIGDPDTALKILEDAHIPCAPLLTVPEVMEHPHTKARNMLRTIVDPVWGELKIPRTPLRFSAFPDTPVQTASYVGEHNQEILSEVLGYSNEDIDALETQGVINSIRS